MERAQRPGRPRKRRSRPVGGALGGVVDMLHRSGRLAGVDVGGGRAAGGSGGVIGEGLGCLGGVGSRSHVDQAGDRWDRALVGLAVHDQVVVPGRSGNPGGWCVDLEGFGTGRRERELERPLVGVEDVLRRRALDESTDSISPACGVPRLNRSRARRWGSAWEPRPVQPRCPPGRHPAGRGRRPRRMGRPAARCGSSRARARVPGLWCGHGELRRPAAQVEDPDLGGIGGDDGI